MVKVVISFLIVAVLGAFVSSEIGVCITISVVLSTVDELTSSENLLHEAKLKQNAKTVKIKTDFLILSFCPPCFTVKKFVLPKLIMP